MLFHIFWFIIHLLCNKIMLILYFFKILYKTLFKCYTTSIHKYLLMHLCLENMLVKRYVSKPYTFDIGFEEAVLQAASCRQLLLACFYTKLFCFADFCCVSQVSMKITHATSQNFTEGQNEASRQCYIGQVNNKTFPAKLQHLSWFSAVKLVIIIHCIVNKTLHLVMEKIVRNTCNYCFHSMSLMQVHIYAYKLSFLVPHMLSYMNQFLTSEVHEKCSKCLLVVNVYFIQCKLIV